jgi:hypothetical protein
MANATLPASSNIEAPQAPVYRASSSNLNTSIDRLKALYKASHQAEFLSIHAEVDTLILQLQQAIRQHSA